MFSIKTAIDSTEPVFVGDSHGVVTKNVKKPTKNQKVVIKKVSAIKLGQKLLVIKGFSEDNTQPVEKEGVDLLPAEVFPIDYPIETTEIEVIVSDQEGVSALNESGDITEYEVVSGDSVEAIAKKFSISPETILWANDLKKQNPIHVGQKLVILPISGVAYTIKSGDTVSEIADKFNITQSELSEFNSLEDGKLSVGEVIVIPGGKLAPAKPVKVEVKPSKPVTSTGGTSANVFSRPTKGVKTQGIHGHNGIDIAASYGTPILAAAGGTVTLVRGGDGWNGGYGNYVVITHKKGVQTLYAHMSSLNVRQGQTVSKGQQVGGMGSTGRSTGVHLHFEVRGAKNPF